MRRGEIRWYRFRPPDKQRPVLVLTRDTMLDTLGEVTIAPITSTVRSIPAQVVLTESDGMPHACAITLDHVQTVPKAKIGRLITTLGTDRMEEVRTALLFALGFPIEPKPR